MEHSFEKVSGFSKTAFKKFEDDGYEDIVTSIDSERFEGMGRRFISEDDAFELASQSISLNRPRIYRLH